MLFGESFTLIPPLQRSVCSLGTDTWKHPSPQQAAAVDAAPETPISLMEFNRSCSKYTCITDPCFTGDGGRLSHVWHSSRGKYAAMHTLLCTNQRVGREQRRVMSRSQPRCLQHVILRDSWEITHTMWSIHKAFSGDRRDGKLQAIEEILPESHWCVFRFH